MYRNSLLLSVAIEWRRQDADYDSQEVLHVFVLSTHEQVDRSRRAATHPHHPPRPQVKHTPNPRLHLHALAHDRLSSARCRLFNCVYCDFGCYSRHRLESHCVEKHDDQPFKVANFDKRIDCVQVVREDPDGVDVLGDLKRKKYYQIPTKKFVKVMIILRFLFYVSSLQTDWRARHDA